MFLFYFYGDKIKNLSQFKLCVCYNLLWSMFRKQGENKRKRIIKI